MLRDAINDTLGVTVRKVTVAGELVGHHIFRKKLLSFTQDSSTFMILFFSCKSWIIRTAYYYLSTKHLSELDWMGTFLTIL